MSAKQTPPPSPNPRKEAARILQRILHDGAFANRLLDVSLTTHKWDPRDANLLTELLYGVLRTLNSLDAIVDKLAKKGLKSIDPFVLHHLRIALYQLLYLDRIPPHAVLSEAVAAIRKKRGKAVAGFVNALLRKYLRDPETFAENPEENQIEKLVRVTSHPTWLVERYIAQYGEEAEKHLQINNQQPPLTLRVNRAWGSRERMLEQLQKEGIEATAATYSPDGVYVTQGQSNQLHKLMRKHPTAWTIQDEAAQLLGHWLAPQAGELILDACAAPGGKTTHLAGLAPQATIVACDIYEHKVSLIQQTCRRLHLSNVDVIQKDATEPFEQQFDRILCDAPCSGLGILRRQPEIRYRRTQEDLKRLQELQTKLLDNLANALKPDGIWLFSVCTDTEEENQQVVSQFLADHPNFSVMIPTQKEVDWKLFVDENGHFRPKEYNMDGFFAICFQKQSEQTTI